LIATRSKNGSTHAGTTDPPAAGRRASTKHLLAAALVAAALLAGCTSQGGYKTSHTPPKTTAAKAPATWDAESHASAQKAAAKLLTTWSQPALSYEQWWADLKDLLSPEARESYSYTDPDTVPDIEITGRGVETNNDNPHVVTITFPTTHGLFGVDLSRSSLHGRWIGESIIFPGEASRLQG
jgi:outer membrane murein-binding lipoprotein Lpp